MIMHSNYQDDEPGFENPLNSTSWSGNLGGDGMFGRDIQNWGYFVSEVNDGNWREDATVQANIVGQYMTLSQLGFMEGNLYGIHDDKGYWINKIVGAYAGEDLAFVSRVNEYSWSGQSAINLYSNVVKHEGHYKTQWQIETGPNSSRSFEHKYLYEHFEDMSRGWYRFKRGYNEPTEVNEQIKYPNVQEEFTFNEDGTLYGFYRTKEYSLTNPTGKINRDSYWNQGEVYGDDNNNDRYDLGEGFLDANGNGVWDSGLTEQDYSFLENPINLYLDEIPEAWETEWHSSWAETVNKGTIDGIFGSLTSLWGEDPVDVSYMGVFDYGYSEDSDLGAYFREKGMTWGGKLYSHDYITGMNTAYDGGAYYGFINGIILPESSDDNALILMKSLAKMIYIDNNGNVGHIDGTLTGGGYSGIGMFNQVGTLANNQVLTAAEYASIPGITVVSAENLKDHLNGNSRTMWEFKFNGVFDNNSVITSGSEMTTGSECASVGIDGLNWGIYALNHIAGVHETPSSSWSGFCGGKQWAFSESESAFWIAEINDGTLANDIFEGEISDSIIQTETARGTLTGKFLGISNSDNSWQMGSLGTWQITPLDWTGAGYSGRIRYYENNPEERFLTNLGQIESKFAIGGDGLLWGDESNSMFYMIGDINLNTGNRYSAGGFAEQVYNGQPAVFTDFKIASYNIDREIDTLGGALIGNHGGAFAGQANGFWHQGQMIGNALALCILPGEGEEPTSYECGFLYTEDPITGNFHPGIEMWEAAGEFTLEIVGETTISPEDFISSGYWNEECIDDDDFYLGTSWNEQGNGGGLGSFSTGGEITCNSVRGYAVSIIDQDWGAIYFTAGGTWTAPNSPYRLAMAGKTDDGAYWLGTLGGNWEPGNLMNGLLKGVALYTDEEMGGNIGVNVIEGKAEGSYIEVEDSTNTWQAAGVGAWVDVAEILPETLGLESIEDFTTQMDALVSVPITETYAASLIGSNGFITGCMMDISLYDNDLWAALIYGNYNGAAAPTDNAWTLGLTEGADSVNLSGDYWSDGEWHADVTGWVNDSPISGEAGGMYSDGVLKGAGVGTVAVE
jgi:hypothetical protein